MTDRSWIKKIEPKRLNKIAPVVIKHNTNYLNTALDSLVELNLTMKKTELLKHLNELSEAQEKVKLEEQKQLEEEFATLKSEIAEAKDAGKKAQITASKKDASLKKNTEFRQNPEEVSVPSEGGQINDQIPEKEHSPVNDQPSQDVTEQKTPQVEPKKISQVPLKNKVSTWNLNTGGTLNILILLYGFSLLLIAFGITYFLIFS